MADTVDVSNLITQLMGGSGNRTTTNNISQQAQDMLTQAFNTAGSGNSAAQIQDILDKAAQAFAPTLANQSAAGGYNTASTTLLSGYAQAQAAKQAIIAHAENANNTAKTQAQIAQVLANGTNTSKQTSNTSQQALAQLAGAAVASVGKSILSNDKVKGYLNDGIDSVMNAITGGSGASSSVSLVDNMNGDTSGATSMFSTDSDNADAISKIFSGEGFKFGMFGDFGGVGSAVDDAVDLTNAATEGAGTISSASDAGNSFNWSDLFN